MPWIKTFGYYNLYYTHAKILRANGKDEEADKNLLLAYEWMMKVANKTQDETFRSSWLENVEMNREIMASAIERGLDK